MRKHNEDDEDDLPVRRTTKPAGLVARRLSPHAAPLPPRYEEEEDYDEDDVPVRHLRHRYHDLDEDDDDYDLPYDPDEELERIVRTIERSRRQLDHALLQLNELLEHYPALEQEWRRFQNAGGITSEDLERFLNGDNKRSRLIPRRRHLRLISSRQPVVRRRLRVRKPGDEPDDAA